MPFFFLAVAAAAALAAVVVTVTIITAAAVAVAVAVAPLLLPYHSLSFALDLFHLLFGVRFFAVSCILCLMLKE